ncbi:aminopeptidase [Clostridium estertheticum]|nr:aminopeptidase [Clostridium estertheticum]MBU3072154.1 aminopeptidase [Clostridium estertheticum]MBU3162246.1 aminopeptidase [Clostridium estertheticum]MBU3170677.1 aminopeptidase [Clostridium estertheticum]MBZ9614501.1 aminopeptidase [Clostridium estertheticum subsp. laramiense]WAG74430.1 aminopeptidase [Clostridium estertheticum]
MDNKLLEKYALLLVKTGINIQKDQTLVINSPIECAAFTRIVSKIAYIEGAREVVVTWRDELSTKIKFMFAPEEIFSEYPDWQRDFYVSSARKGAAFLSISASDPELMKDVNPERLSKSNKAASTAIKEYRDRMMSNKNVWCVASIPTQAWANKVFPKVSEDEAMEKLWNAIFKTVRVDALDPVASWETHKSNLKKSMDYLNLNNFKYLQYKNSLGTDLKIELPENHLWLGGSDYTPGGVEFIANMPTEEVFTLPKKTGVNGIVVSSKPLNYNGNLIENFSLTFEKGKVVDFKAETGYDILKSIIETDEGSCYLGEVALVPYDSPISNSNILFYNTLFDENASCHLALGKAYPVCIKNGENLSNEELSKLEVNDSFVHEDFMVGTEDLQIIGITADGKEVSVFEKGNFAF